MSSSYSQPSRRRHTKSRIGPSNRNSTAVRASVLQTALELGVAQNSTVANWIFNNPLEEEPEDSSLDQVHDLPEKEVAEVRPFTFFSLSYLNRRFASSPLHPP